MTDILKATFTLAICLCFPLVASAKVSLTCAFADADKAIQITQRNDKLVWIEGEREKSATIVIREKRCSHCNRVIAFTSIDGASVSTLTYSASLTREDFVDPEQPELGRIASLTTQQRTSSGFDVVHASGACVSKDV